MFLMDSGEIDRLTHGVAPLRDSYPKRLSDAPWDEQASHRFASEYMQGSYAARALHGSRLFGELWQETPDGLLESCFTIRELRYRCGVVERCNPLAELDIYLRQSRLRTPVLEVLGSDEFRLAMAEQIARQSEPPPAQIMPDLIAGALARRDIDGAILLLEREKRNSSPNINDTFLLTYLYCLNGDIEKAEMLAASHAQLIKKNWFVDWLWEKLHTDFGFDPPS
jgi:hypothetical protein